MAEEEEEVEDMEEEVDMTIITEAAVVDLEVSTNCLLALKQYFQKMSCCVNKAR